MGYAARGSSGPRGLTHIDVTPPIRLNPRLQGVASRQHKERHEHQRDLQVSTSGPHSKIQEDRVDVVRDEGVVKKVTLIAWTGHRDNAIWATARSVDHHFRLSPDSVEKMLRCAYKDSKSTTNVHCPRRLGDGKEDIMKRANEQQRSESAI